MDKLTAIANKQRHTVKPIKYWQVVSYHGNLGPKVIDQNNNIAFLRAKYGNSVVYKPVR